MVVGGAELCVAGCGGAEVASFQADATGASDGFILPGVVLRKAKQSNISLFGSCVPVPVQDVRCGLRWRRIGDRVVVLLWWAK